jgi:hypothetical protein
MLPFTSTFNSEFETKTRLLHLVFFFLFFPCIRLFNMTLPDNEQEHRVNETMEPLLQSDRDSSLVITKFLHVSNTSALTFMRKRKQSSNSKEEGQKEVIQFYIEQLTLLFYPLILTFALTCWIETTLAIDNTTIR